MIKYIGSKRVLVDRIVAIVDAVPGVARVCDLFTGTTRVAQGLKRAGYHVTANDAASYSEVLARTYVAVDARAVDTGRIRGLLARLEALPGRRGYFTRTFCEEARYFQPHNGRRIDAVRDAIERVARDQVERSILLTSLMEAADRVDSTTGVQMAYLKRWSQRSHRGLELRMPTLIPGPGRVLREDAVKLARELDDVDLVYLDPPYNQHSYFSNYHIWETLVRHDRPATYGKARKRVDCRTRKSDFNSRRRAWEALASVVRSIRARHVLLSFSDEGFFERAAILDLLAERGDEVAWTPVDSRRYVGARIGIYNPAGEKVGRVSHVTNREFLFLAGPGAGAALERMQEQLRVG